MLTGGESQTEAHERILKVVKDSDIELTIQMNHLERLQLKSDKKRGLIFSTRSLESLN